MTSALPRLELPPARGVSNLAFRLRWALSSPDRRMRSFNQILWNPLSWKDETAATESLRRMQVLSDLGLFSSFDGLDSLSRRLSFRANDIQRACLVWDAMRAIQLNLPAGAVHILINAGACVELRESNNYADSLLSCAVRCGNLPVVRLLLQAGATTELVDTCDDSPLSLAVGRAARVPQRQSGRVALDIMEALLVHGADPDYAARYCSSQAFPRDAPPKPLVRAASMRWSEGVDRLLAAGARVDGVGQVSGAGFAQQWIENMDAGTLAPLLNHHPALSPILDRLLAAGLDLNHASLDGTNALQVAIQKGAIGLALLLWEKGARPGKGPVPLPHLLVDHCPGNNTLVQDFLDLMPEDFWSLRNSEGKTAADVLQQRAAERPLGASEDKWLSLICACDLDRETPGARVRPNPRSRL